MPVTALAAAALPPIVVATVPATAAKAGAANPPALTLQPDCNYIVIILPAASTLLPVIAVTAVAAGTAA